MSDDKTEVKMCKRGIHDLNDPNTVLYVQPSNGTRQCAVCHAEQVKEYRARPKGPCKRCGSTNRQKNGTCNECARKRKEALEVAEDEFL
jgi:predicted acyl esterase